MNRVLPITEKEMNLLMFQIDQMGSLDYFTMLEVVLEQYGHLSDIDVSEIMDELIVDHRQLRGE